MLQVFFKTTKLIVTTTMPERSLTNPSLWHIRAGARKLQTEYSKNEDENKKIAKEGWHEEVEDKGDLWDEEFKDLDSKERVKRGGEGHIHLHVKKVFVHPNYNGGQIEWDIALMKLKTPIDQKYLDKSVEIIKLPSESDSKKWPKIGQKCVLVGWGCKTHKGSIAEYGQLASLKVLTHAYCEQVYEQGADLNKDHEFCAGSVSSGHGVCEGDSGSGLACEKDSEWALAGVASATHGDNPANYPGIFTRVSYFIPWIKAVIAKN